MIYNTGESGFYLDTSYDGKFVATPKFTLPKGFYTFEMQYECKNEAVIAINFQYSDGQIEKDIIGSNCNACDLRVKYNNRPIQVWGRLTSEAEDGDYLLIRNISIVTSPLDIKYFIFRHVVLFLVINLLLLSYSVKGKFHIGEELQFHLKVLVILICISSIPLMVNYLFRGAHDLEFHLMRIEGLSEGLLYGKFPVRIQPGWLDGHGYAVSVFYGDILLYLPAMLRLFGISIQASYQFYVFFINTVTVLIAYYCFRGMSCAKIGLVCTIVYTLNIYRLTCIYTRAAVGEYTAMAFIPLVLYGLWKVYTLSEESKEHQRSWVDITVGCCGIFFSHMITTEMAAFFIIITVVMLWKVTIRRKIFLVLMKAAGMTALLTCWFFVPFLDYMVSGSYVINNQNSYIKYNMENTGIFLSQLFMTDYSVVGVSQSVESGIVSEMPQTAGLSALFILVGWFLLCFGKKERVQSGKRAEYFAVFLCVLSLWMATNLFPYTWLADKFPILKMPIRSIQFSWRFLTAAGTMLVYLLCLMLKKKWLEVKKRSCLLDC